MGSMQKDVILGEGLSSDKLSVNPITIHEKQQWIKRYPEASNGFNHLNFMFRTRYYRSCTQDRNWLAGSTFPTSYNTLRRGNWLVLTSLTWWRRARVAILSLGNH